jgi:hypothetical protein
MVMEFQIKKNVLLVWNNCSFSSFNNILLQCWNVGRVISTEYEDVTYIILLVHFGVVVLEAFKISTTIPINT